MFTFETEIQFQDIEYQQQKDVNRNIRENSIAELTVPLSTNSSQV